MRYLVTGGAGFIGSHVCEAVVARGDVVIALDDLSSGRTDHLSALAGHDRFTLVHGSALDAPLVAELAAGCDVVAHLASDVGVHQTLSRPARLWWRNTGGARVVLNTAAARHLPTLLVSTSEVYGPRPPVPVPETAPQVAPVMGPPRWAYAASKAFSEREAARLHGAQRLPVVVARLFNTVGPRQRPAYGMVLPRFIDQARTGADLTIHGDGEQRRCFCHVEDTVAALLGLLDHPGAIGGTFNVGGTAEATIADLARVVLDVTGSSSRMRLVPYHEAYAPGYEDVRRRVPDLTSVRRLLGWEPCPDLSAIVERIVGRAPVPVPVAGPEASGTRSSP